MIVVAISDPQATKTIVSNIRQICRTTHVIVRTRFISEIDDLLNIGADEVIPEEFETSIEIFARVMHKYLVPLDEIENLEETFRTDNYQFLSPHHKKAMKNMSLPGAMLNIECVRVGTDHGPMLHQTIAENQIRNTYGVNILAIVRGDELISNIKPGEHIRYNDLLYISGEQQNISDFYDAVNK